MTRGEPCPVPPVGSPAEQARAEVEKYGAGLEFDDQREDLIADLVPIYERAQANDDAKEDADGLRLLAEQHRREIATELAEQTSLRERAERAEAEVEHITADKKLCDYEIARLVKAKDAAVERANAVEAECDVKDAEIEALTENAPMLAVRLTTAEADVARLREVSDDFVDYHSETCATCSHVRRGDPKHGPDPQHCLGCALREAFAATEPT